MILKSAPESTESALNLTASSPAAIKAFQIQVAHNEQVLPMVGKLKNLRLDNRSQIENILMKIKTKSQIDNVQPEPKPNSELLPIAPTSSPTIGNTLVSSSAIFRSGHSLIRKYCIRSPYPL